MINNKRSLIFAIIIIAFVIGLWYIYLDFSRFFGARGDTFPSSLIKRIEVVLAFFIVLLTGKHKLNQKDSILMKLTFIAICFAEVGFLLSKTYVGIFFFLICQIFLIFRNGQNLKQNLISIQKKDLYKLIVSGVVIFVVLLLLIAGIFYPALKFTNFLFIMFIYGMTLSISLWVGLASYFLNLFPRKNSLMILIGMICFFVSDFLVGIHLVMKHDTFVWLLANSFVWVLYNPAIILLALSGYDYDCNK